MEITLKHLDFLNYICSSRSIKIKFLEAQQSGGFTIVFNVSSKQKPEYYKNHFMSRLEIWLNLCWGFFLIEKQQPPENLEQDFVTTLSPLLKFEI